MDIKASCDCVWKVNLHDVNTYNVTHTCPTHQKVQHTHNANKVKMEFVPDRKLTVVEGDIIDITDFLETHPGGSIINACIGIDSTVMFATHHPFALGKCRELLSGMKVGRVAEGEYIKRSKFYDTLTNTLSNEPMYRKGDSRRIRLKAFTMIALMCLLIPLHSSGYVPATVLLSFVYYMFAAQVMHEAGHESGDHPVFNQVMKVVSSFAGVGGHPRWVYKHLRHHAVTNDKGDPELNIHPILRLRSDFPKWWLHKYMHYYAVLIYSVLHIDNFIENLLPQPTHVKGIPIHTNTRVEKFIAYTAASAFAFVHLCLPFIFGGGMRAIVMELVLTCPASLIVTLMFQVSHVSTHVEKTSGIGTDLNTTTDWAINQILNSCNYSMNNRFITELAGGLNYQIEHHIFPTITHNALPRVSKALQQLCLDEHVSYHAFPTLVDAIRDHFSLLRSRGV